MAIKKTRSLNSVTKKILKKKKELTIADKIKNPKLAGEVILDFDGGMQIENLNWDELYKEDIASGIGFDIDDVKAIDKNDKRSDRGIYSNLFGTELSDDIESNDTYSCKCKKLQGAFYYDEKNPVYCPNCGEPVKKNVTDMKKTGWITLREGIHLINPLYYYMMEKLIGSKNLNNIIFYNKDRDEDGNIIYNMDYFDDKNPFYTIGMIEFYERFDEILDYYHENITGVPSVRQNKEEIYQFLKANKESVFCNHFPVYTLLLRPILIIKNTAKNKKNNMIFADINSKYQLLVTNVCDLNKDDTTFDLKSLKVLPLMYQSQTILNKIHKTTIDNQISGKEGHIRGSMLGERVNFSARAVIVPLIGHYQLNEIKLPYLMFLELYKYEIMNLLCRLDKMTINESIKRWNKALERFDKRIYQIMKLIIEKTKGGLYCFINRNPSLNYGSMLVMKVIDVKSDYDDLTMSVPLNVLGLLAADFDGDVMNIISIKSREFVNHYKNIFDPRMMLIDRNNGKFNRKLSLIKDQMIGLYAFCRDD